MLPFSSCWSNDSSNPPESAVCWLCVKSMYLLYGFYLISYFVSECFCFQNKNQSCSSLKKPVCWGHEKYLRCCTIFLPMHYQTEAAQCSRAGVSVWPNAKGSPLGKCCCCAWEELPGEVVMQTGSLGFGYSKQKCLEGTVCWVCLCQNILVGKQPSVISATACHFTLWLISDCALC